MGEEGVRRAGETDVRSIFDFSLYYKTENASYWYVERSISNNGDIAFALDS